MNVAKRVGIKADDAQGKSLRRSPFTESRNKHRHGRGLFSSAIDSRLLDQQLNCQHAFRRPGVSGRVFILPSNPVPPIFHRLRDLTEHKNAEQVRQAGRTGIPSYYPAAPAPFGK
jgi:hypothetical protein